MMNERERQLLKRQSERKVIQSTDRYFALKNGGHFGDGQYLSEEELRNGYRSFGEMNEIEDSEWRRLGRM